MQLLSMHLLAQDRKATLALRVVCTAASGGDARLRRRCRRRGSRTDRFSLAPADTRFAGNELHARALCPVTPPRTPLAGTSARRCNRNSKPRHGRSRAAQLYKFPVRPRCAFQVRTRKQSKRLHSPRLVATFAALPVRRWTKFRWLPLALACRPTETFCFFSARNQYRSGLLPTSPSGSLKWAPWLSTKVPSACA